MIRSFRGPSRIAFPTLLALAFALASTVPSRAEDAPKPLGPPAPVGPTGPLPPPSVTPGARGPLVQVALLLDTSSSMEGLLQQAKTQLWKIVNEVAGARFAGRAPVFQVALYEYGNKNLPKEAGFVRRVAPLTDDLDKVSEELFALRILSRGSEEFCGRAIGAAARELDWSGSPDALKVIFVAGNESFAQGDLDYRTACRDALAKSIAVNTIYCGSREEGIRLGWEDGAKQGEGTYCNIDQDVAPAAVETPQDAEIIRLGEDLNKTYVPYGAAGAAGRLRQASQDRNAAESRDAAVERGISKGTDLYVNPEWDLVDAVEQDKVRVEDLKDADLPDEVRKLDLDGKKAYIERKAKERAEIRARIAALTAAREKEVAKSLAERSSAAATPAPAAATAAPAASGGRIARGAREAKAEAEGDAPADGNPAEEALGGAAPGGAGAPPAARAETRSDASRAARPGAPSTLDTAVIRALREQAQKKGFSFDGAKAEAPDAPKPEPAGGAAPEAKPATGAPPAQAPGGAPATEPKAG